MKPLILLTVLLMSLHSNATVGNDKGNGGFAIQCATDGTLRTEVLDLYEARWVRSLQMKQFNSQDPYEIAILAARRLTAESPRRAARYEAAIREFREKARFVSEARWTDVGDYGPIFIPNNCQVIPVAIQKRFSIEEEPTFFVNREIWNMLSVDDQAALVLHEIVYLEFAHETSVLTRSFVGLLFSMEFENYVGRHRFLEMLKKVGAPTYEYGSFDINIRQGYVATSEYFVRAFVMPGVYDDGVAKIPYRYQRVDFYQTGTPKFLYLPGAISVKYPVRCFGVMELTTEVDSAIRFAKTGRLQRADFNTERSIMDPVGCNGTRYQIKPGAVSGWFSVDEHSMLQDHNGIEVLQN
jgi:hypothetical protein